MLAIDGTPHTVELPETSASDFSQDREYCILKNDLTGEARNIRFHDYHEIYAVPGLYEHIFYRLLKCKSPQTVCDKLKGVVETSEMNMSDLNVLDFGAGNGMVGEKLIESGAGSVTGIDIIEEAEEAALRDRPEIYDDYYVEDMTRLNDSTREKLERKNFNCLLSVSALGFGDVPPLAFAEAFNLVNVPGWIAFNIKNEFVGDDDPSGFSKMIKRATESDILDVRVQHRYRHRLSVNGEPLYYVSMIGEKKNDIPLSWAVES